MPSDARVLIMDDDLHMRTLLSEALADEGYAVVTHGNWRTALDEVRRVQPNILLLDLCMAGSQTGWQILDGVTLDRRTREIPVVVYSAAADALAARQLALLPQHGVRSLTKPFDLNVLLDTVRDAVT